MADGRVPLLGHVMHLSNPIPFFKNAKEKYGEAVTIQVLSRYMIFIVDQGPLSEYFRAREDTLSFKETLRRNGLVRIFYGFHDTNLADINGDAVKKSTAVKFDWIVEEEMNAAMDALPSSGEMDVFMWSRRVISRITFRAFLGMPIQPALQDDILRYEIDVSAALGARFALPGWYCEWKLCPNLDRQRDDIMQKLLPIIEDAKKMKDKTVYLSFILGYVDEATGQPLSDLDIANMILNVNFAAVANSANGVAQALVFMAKHPNLTELLIDDVGASNPGTSSWTNAWALETARLTASMQGSVRFVMSDDVSVGGYRIPEGTLVCIAAAAMNRDNEFERTDDFDPRRFVSPQSLSSHLKYPVTTWGAGVHLCPGKILSVSEMKWAVGLMAPKYEMKVVECNDVLQYQGGTAICAFTKKTILAYKKR
eukprot:TRINITY_DN11588_c0_g1_i2.p1 TRINITY_DN11588_c0_g1~~TRINITY_DN11588_c0_g1_i2.p1  ORF type:complete len:478 (-),score=63.25 TRINITY_DN11588_c0_g1_i2:67-1338(-)